MSNLYIVEVTEGEQERTRYIVVANDAPTAEAIVGAAHLPTTSVQHLRIGRLGTYEPGMEGAAMAPLSIIGTWEVDES